MVTIKDLINLDINAVQRMTRKELSQVVSTLSSAANKRLNRLQQSPVGDLSPAYQQALKRGQRFSVAGKNVNQLRNEYKAVTQFLKRKTSTISGWNKVRNETMTRIGGGFSNADEERRFWELYRKLESSELGGVMTYGSTESQRLLRQEMTQGDGDGAIIANVISRLDEEYVKQQMSLYGEDFDDYESGDFFTIEEDNL